MVWNWGPTPGDRPPAWMREDLPILLAKSLSEFTYFRKNVLFCIYTLWEITFDLFSFLYLVFYFYLTLLRWSYFSSKDDSLNIFYLDGLNILGM